MKSRFMLAAALIAGAGWVAEAQQAGVPTGDLADLPVEELLNLQVTSVGRKAQRLSRAPAAVFVITQDDLRRSGATTIAEALRMAPGLTVSRIDGSSWAVSARGFHRPFSNKLLVLMDGRSVYTNMFSGVFWDIQDGILEDIDRIEVIRGPGAVMWGANAVNGVINIITRPAKATQGGLVTATAGTEDRPVAGARWGGRIGENAWYRAYAKGGHRQMEQSGSTLYGRSYFGHEAATPAIPYRNQPEADWNLFRAGFRLDWNRSAKDAVTVQGDVYGAAVNQTIRIPALQSPWVRLIAGQEKPSGGNVLTRWTRAHGSGESALQVYADRADRDASLAEYGQDTIDIDYQRRRLLSDSHELYWGLGYRATRDAITPFFAFVKNESRTASLFSGVLRDEYSMLGDRLLLSGGVRLEHNGYSGFEYQPSGRALFSRNAQESIWVAWSRAVRTPSRLDHDLQVDTLTDYRQRLPVLVQYAGNPGFRSEKVLAHEIGFRRVFGARWSVDAAGFYNRYRDLVTFEPQAPVFAHAPLPHMVVKTLEANKQDGEAAGTEVWGTWAVTSKWKLMPGYAFLTNRFWGKDGSADPNQDSETGTHPKHQAQFRSWIDVSRTVQFDVGIYAVDRMVSPYLAGYARCDARLAWRPRRHMELSLNAQNLLNRRQIETLPDGPYLSYEVRRNLFVRWTRWF